MHILTPIQQKSAAALKTLLPLVDFSYPNHGAKFNLVPESSSYILTVEKLCDNLKRLSVLWFLVFK